MKTFKDNANRTWTLCIHVTAVKRCRALVDIDLYKLIESGFEGLNALLSDPISLVDVLYVLCMDDCKAQGVSDEDFGRGMAGDAIRHAGEAFVEELINFSPEPHLRAGLGRAIEKVRRAQNQIGRHLEAEVDRINVDLLVRESMKSSGDTLASLGLIQDPSPSENSSPCPKDEPPKPGTTPQI